MSRTDQHVVPQPVHVVYCGICTFPPEYCEFGLCLTKCKTWLCATHPELYEKCYPEEVLLSTLGMLGIKERSKALAKFKKDAAQIEAKAKAQADHALKKKMESKKIVIKRVQRNKDKVVTIIHGLKAFDIDLKKAAKYLARGLAAGAWVSENIREKDKDELVVQGDVWRPILKLIKSNAGELQGIPIANVHVVDDNEKVVIKRNIERSTQSPVTVIQGLKAFDVPMRKATKFLAYKLTTDAWVPKNARGKDKIVVRGDLSEKILELIVSSNTVFEGIPAGRVKIAGNKKKNMKE